MAEDRIPVKCPHCGREYEVYPELAGMEFPCRYCNSQFQCPDGPPSPSVGTRHSAARAVLRRLRTFTLRGWLVTVAALLLFFILASAGLNLALIHLWSWYYLILAIVAMVYLLFIDLFILFFVSVHAWSFNNSQARIRRKGAWLVAGMGTCPVAYALTMWRAEWYLILLNYGIALLFIGLGIYVAAVPFPAHRRLSGCLATGMGILLFIFLAWADRFENYWTSEDTGNRYLDTRGRFTARWNHRTMYLKDDDIYWFWKGPMTASWKPHGHWRHVLKPGVGIKMLKEPGGVVSHKELTNAWYWYGQEISEGEWHLRSK